MDLIKAVKFDAEFLEYFDNILVTVIPSLSLSMSQPERLKTIDKIIRALLINDKYDLDRANPDWVSLIKMAAKHYEPEVQP